MDILEMIRTYSSGKGEKVMWKTVEQISNYIEKHKDNTEEYENLKKELYADMMGHHYDETFAMKQLEKMYYEDGQKNKHYAPYWSKSDMSAVYKNLKHMINPEITEYDFWVALNMIKSDYVMLLKAWWPELTDQQIDAKVVDMTVTYLNDPDAESKGEMIWNHYN